MIKIRAVKKHNVSLSGKIIIIIITFILMCAVLWTGVMFLNMTGNAKDIALNDEKAYMEALDANVASVQEVCNLAKQVVSRNATIKEYIQLRQNSGELSSIEKIDFYNNEIASIDNMTNVNPYLYQIRMFVNADITEKKPCFYRIDRMKHMEWAGNYRDNEWQIDYLDKVFLESINKNLHLAGLISEIKDDNGKLLAVLEVSTSLENLFTNYYNDNDDEFSCFIDNNGVLYCSDFQRETWNINREKLLNYIKYNKQSSFLSVFNKEDSIVSVREMPSLKGTFIHVKGMEDSVDSYYRSQMPYIFVVFISMLVFIIIVVISIRNIFKRFNTLTSEVSKIKDGKNIRLPEHGNDEISALGKQINKMISSLENLNEENTRRQLLVKNAEIKSLQNQINAHFMYNVLETIKMMAEIKEEFEISDAITSLGQMFRYSMKWTSGMVELEEEIKYIKNYLNLLNLRFDYEIYLSLNIPKEYMSLRIPKMSLQPLVENSVYHGIENIAEDTYIYIKAFAIDNIVNIEVSDAGVGMSEQTLNELRERINATEGVDDSKEHGRALYNVSQRIKMYFGSEYGLQIFSKEGVYTKVLIQIPLDKEINL